MNNSDKSRPWYQEPYVWLVISFPLSAVLAGIVTTYLAIVSYDGLVVDDYYKQGLEINKRLDREQYAQQYGLSIEASLRHDKLTVDFNRGSLLDMPSQLMVTVSHATKPGFDQTLPLTQEANNQYAVAPVNLPAGRWYIDIGTPEWRVTDVLVVH